MATPFTAACMLIALHIVADAFIAPEPGTDAGDHVIPAVLPLAILALALWFFPRVRAGARASIAIVLGILALAGGGVAIAAIRDGQGGLDEWTGVLLGPAGIALIALGAVALWRSRKPEGRPLLRRTLIGLGAVVVLYELVLPIALAIVVTHRPDGSTDPPDIAGVSVTIKTDDGLRLAATYVPSDNGAAVITYPERDGAVDHAEMLARNGYGVLLLDARGYGASEGDPNAFGWGQTADIDAAVDFLEGRPEVDEGAIGGLGLSVGGEQMIDAAAENPALVAAVADGAGERSVKETLIRGSSAALAIPQQLVLTTGVAVFSGDSPPPSLDDQVGRISPRSLFLIYAENGGGGEDLNPDYYEAAGEPKEIWEVPGAGHTGGIDAEPEEYERRVVDFLDGALLGAGQRP